MNSDTIRIGVVGAGRSARGSHMPRFQAIEGVEVVSVANQSRESAQRVADEFRIPNVYDSWVDLIRAPDTDAIFIGTWPYMHRTLAVAALDNGKHVLTQARMASNAQEAREMLDASLRNPHLVAQVVPTKTIHTVEETIDDLIHDGYLGDILSADITACEGFIDRDRVFFWRDDRDLSGYNAMSIGIMGEVMIRLFGPMSSVTAITRVHVPRRTDEAGNSRFVTLPDHAEILCEMASGPVVHARISQVTGLGPSNAIWIFGTQGTLRFDIDSQELYGGRRGDEGLTEIETPLEKQRGRFTVDSFINAIRGIHPVTHTTFEDGVRYMEFTEAVARSAQSRETVYLPF